jgi:hypothetical protein
MSHYSLTYETDPPFDPTPFYNNSYHTYSQDEHMEPPPTTPQYNEREAPAAQPQYDTDLFVSPNSAVAQLGLTLAEVRELLAHQEAYLREEYQAEQRRDSPRDTEHQQQQYVQPPTRNHQLPTTETYEPPRLIADELAQLGYTPAEIEELDQDCIRQQNEWIVIEEAARIGREKRKVRDMQEEYEMWEPESRVQQTTGTDKTQEIRPEEHRNEARWVPTSPFLTPNLYCRRMRATG